MLLCCLSAVSSPYTNYSNITCPVPHCHLQKQVFIIHSVLLPCTKKYPHFKYVFAPTCRNKWYINSRFVTFQVFKKVLKILDFNLPVSVWTLFLYFLLVTGFIDFFTKVVNFVKEQLVPGPYEHSSPLCCITLAVLSFKPKPWCLPKPSPAIFCVHIQYKDIFRNEDFPLRLASCPHSTRVSGPWNGFFFFLKCRFCLNPSNFLSLWTYKTEHLRKWYLSLCMHTVALCNE